MLVNDKLDPGTIVMHVNFMFFAVFKNLKSPFSEDNMPEYALSLIIENAAKMVQKKDQTLR